MSRKSQIHMLETIIVLAVFFILVMLGAIFYSKILESSIETEKQEIIQLTSIKIAQRASFLPELQCSHENIVTDNCIDILKLKATSEIIEENEIYYFDKFSFSRIFVSEIYPDQNTWILYDKPLEDYSYKLVTNIPISLFDPIENKNAFGVLSLELFSKS